MKKNHFQTLDNVLLRLKKKYCFDIHDSDDIYQEGFIIGMTGITQYKISLGISLETFLYVYISSRLKNFQRDNSLRQDSRCNNCKEFNPECKQCQARDKTQQRKKNILNPISIDVVNTEGEKSFASSQNVALEVEILELTKKINQALSPSERLDYLRIKEGAYVSRERRQEIERKVWEIIEK